MLTWKSCWIWDHLYHWWKAKHSCTCGWTSTRSTKHLQLVTASREKLSILDKIRAPIRIGELHLMYNYTVVEKLVASVIIGVDFLYVNSLTLDSRRSPVIISQTYPQKLQAERESSYQYTNQLARPSQRCAQ